MTIDIVLDMKPTLCADAVIINDDEEILFVKRSHEPYLGYWNLPGGKVELLEITLDAAIREVEEETGLANLRIGGFCGEFIDHVNDNDIKNVLIYELYLEDDQEVVVNEENEEHIWVPIGGNLPGPMIKVLQEFLIHSYGFTGLDN